MSIAVTHELSTSDQTLTKPRDTLIELINVVKDFETPAGLFRALNCINLTVFSGEFLAVVGKSGSGKSTLTNMITGIDRPTSGEVIVNGTSIHHLHEEEITDWRGKNLGVVFQSFLLIPAISVIDNVILPMAFSNLYTREERTERAMELLKMVEIEQNAYKLPSQISGGQQQRVSIARALACDPAIIVADEPTGSLDSKTAHTVFGIFEKLVDQGKSVLMVTHDHEQADRATRIIQVADGEIV
ncbi:MAG: ABC transporter ATP-binding protein [bacterium]